MNKKAYRKKATRAAARSREEIAERLDLVCIELEGMEMPDPGDTLTDEEVMAVRCGAMSALAMAAAMLGAHGHHRAEVAKHANPRRIAEGIVSVGSRAHLQALKSMG